MIASMLIWALASSAVLALLVGLRWVRLGRRPGVAELSWPSVVVLAVVLGAVLTFLAEIWAPRQVEVPPEVAAPPIGKVSPPASQ